MRSVAWTTPRSPQPCKADVSENDDRVTPSRWNGALVGILILSLLANGLLLERFAVESSRTAKLERQLRAQQAQLDRLRGDLRSVGGSTPLAKLAATVAKIRALDFTEEVTPRTITAASMTDRIRAAFKKENPRAEVDATQKVLARLGVVEADVDLYDLIGDAYGEQVAGFYDSETKELIVVGREATNPGPLDRLILAHEYTHALTDQHFDLQRLERLQDEGQDEAVSALQALGEGDAQFTMGIYRDDVLTKDEMERLVEESAKVGVTAFSRLPPFLQEGFTFPYDAGVSFVGALHASGGWKAIDAAYVDPPVSTEQILHPERYLGPARDEPTDVRMADVRGALGPGWRRLEDGDVGELDVRLVLDTSSGPNLGTAKARRAADGWDGGAYEAFEGAAGTLVALETVWDSSAESREAGQAFERWLSLRYAGAKRADLGPGVVAVTSTDGAGAVIRRDARLIVILGPDVDSVRSASRAFRQSA